MLYVQLYGEYGVFAFTWHLQHLINAVQEVRRPNRSTSVLNSVEENRSDVLHLRTI